MPAVSVYDIEISIQRDLGGKFGDVVYFSKPMASRHGFLTANDVTPYVVSAQSTKAGPLVVEVPPASDKVSYFGTFVDAWQTPIADVGPPGDDKGKGARYLFLPPGYDGVIPSGYLVYRPQTYGVHFAFRLVAKNGGTAADQADYAQTLKVYRLGDAANPPKTTFIDAYPKKWDTLPTYGIGYLKTDAARRLRRVKRMPTIIESVGRRPLLLSTSCDGSSDRLRPPTHRLAQGGLHGARSATAQADQSNRIVPTISTSPSSDTVPTSKSPIAINSIVKASMLGRWLTNTIGVAPLWRAIRSFATA